MERFSHFRRNAGWSGVTRVAVVLALLTVVTSMMWTTTGEWRGVLVVIAGLALPVLIRETLVRHIERTESVLRYGGYSLMACAFVFPFVRDSLGQSLGVLVGASVFAALSLYISAFVAVLSDPRIELSNETWR